MAWLMINPISPISQIIGALIGAWWGTQARYPEQTTRVVTAKNRIKDNVQHKVNNNLINTLCRPAFTLFLRVGFRMTIQRQSVLSTFRKKPLILAGNHTGFLDGPMVLSTARRDVRFVVHTKILKWPIVGRCLKAMGAFDVANSGDGTVRIQSLIKCMHHIKHGGAVCIFPEGKLYDGNAMAPFGPGVVFLHKKTRAPIIPFAIEGGYEAWPWGHWLPLPRQVHIAYGDPIEFSDESNEAVLAKLEAAVAQLKQHLEAQAQTIRDTRHREAPSITEQAS